MLSKFVGSNLVVRFKLGYLLNFSFLGHLESESVPLRDFLLEPDIILVVLLANYQRQRKVPT